MCFIIIFLIFLVYIYIFFGLGYDLSVHKSIHIMCCYTNIDFVECLQCGISDGLPHRLRRTAPVSSVLVVESWRMRERYEWSPSGMVITSGSCGWLCTQAAPTCQWPSKCSSCPSHNRIVAAVRTTNTPRHRANTMEMWPNNQDRRGRANGLPDQQLSFSVFQ